MGGGWHRQSHISNVIYKSINKIVNINYVDKNKNIRTFERGVNEETLACGTGCISSSKYFFDNQEIDFVDFKVKSGETLSVIKKNDKYYLKGIVNKVYEGKY